jgi:hypothetical protein
MKGYEMEYHFQRIILLPSGSKQVSKTRKFKTLITIEGEFLFSRPDKKM